MFLYIKAFRSVIFAIVILVAVELLVLAKTGSKGDDYRLMGLEYLKEIRPEKFMLVNKLSYLVDKDVDIVSVGDSSGMVSLDPKVIEKYLGGMKMYNGNTQQPIGVPGYRYIAEIYLKKNHNIKYLIYHITPHQMKVDDPSRIGWSPYIYQNYLSYYHFIFALPSTEERVKIVNSTYYFGEDKVRAIDIKSRLTNDHGFFGLTLKGDKDIGECSFDGWVNKSGKFILSDELELVKKVTDKYGVKLIVIFGATSCTPGEKIKPIIADLEKFKKNNPDVLVPIGFINHLDASKFGDPVHILPSATDAYSEMIGKILKKEIMGKNSSSSNVKKSF